MHGYYNCPLMTEEGLQHWQMRLVMELHNTIFGIITVLK